MKWFGKGAERRVFQMILASVMTLGTMATGWSQGVEDDFAHDWTELESDQSAIELAGHYSPHEVTIGDSFESYAACDGCDSGCDSCEPACKPCPPWWAHRTGVMGQFMYLRPGSTDLVYTVEQNQVPPNEFPTGPLGISAVGYDPGFRAGFSHAASSCTSLVGSVLYWEGDDFDLIDRTSTNILSSEILHPSRLNAGAFGLQESAYQEIKMGLADIAYRVLWKNTDKFAVNWRGGFQYGGLEQELRWDQTVPSSVAVGTFAVDTDIDFTGFGLMGGVDFERHSCKTGMSCYSKLLASALAGEWQASYVDAPQLAGGVVANQYEDFRVTPVVEVELGLAWHSKCSRFRLNAGYTTIAWFDALSTRTYVEAVKNGNFIDVGETITFSGLTAGGEFRF